MAGGPGGHIPDFAVIEKRTEAEIENLPQLRAFLFFRNLPKKLAVEAEARSILT